MAFLPQERSSDRDRSVLRDSEIAPTGRGAIFIDAAMLRRFHRK
jgi:hypothetical protein